MNYNSITLCGRVARSEEIVYHGAGNACKKFCMAVETRLGGDKVELLYLDCVLWGKQAEAIHHYIIKGRELIVQGRLRLESWDDRQTGQRRSKHICVAQSVQLGQQPKVQQIPQQQEARQTTYQPPSGDGCTDDDIPF